MLSKLEKQAKELLDRWSRHEIYMCESTQKELQKLLKELEIKCSI